jgi:hypothetical protein
MFDKLLLSDIVWLGPLWGNKNKEFGFAPSGPSDWFEVNNLVRPERSCATSASLPGCGVLLLYEQHVHICDAVRLFPKGWEMDPFLLLTLFDFGSL